MKRYSWRFFQVGQFSGTENLPLKTLVPSTVLKYYFYTGEPARNLTKCHKLRRLKKQ